MINSSKENDISLEEAQQYELEYYRNSFLSVHLNFSCTVNNSDHRLIYKSKAYNSGTKLFLIPINQEMQIVCDAVLKGMISSEYSSYINSIKFFLLNFPFQEKAIGLLDHLIFKHTTIRDIVFFRIFANAVIDFVPQDRLNIFQASLMDGERPKVNAYNDYKYGQIVNEITNTITSLIDELKLLRDNQYKELFQSQLKETNYVGSCLDDEIDDGSIEKEFTGELIYSNHKLLLFKKLGLFEFLETNYSFCEKNQLYNLVAGFTGISIGSVEACLKPNPSPKTNMNGKVPRDSVMKFLKGTNPKFEQIIKWDMPKGEK